jgi:hypothetical protein
MTYAPDAEELATFQRVREHFGWAMSDGRTPNLNKALAAFQAEMPAIERDRKVEVVTKGDKDNYGYSYATLANIVRVASPIMGKHGLAFTSSPGTGSDGKGMSVRWALVHESGEERTGEFPISAEGGIQILGGRITYVRRYCMAAALNIAADEDDDAATAQMADDTGGGVRAQRARPAPARSNRPKPRAEADPGTAAELPGGDPAEQADEVPQGMLAHMFGLFGQLGLTDRDQRLAAVSSTVGREITSSHDMSKAEVQSVIDAAQARLDAQTPADGPTDTEA